MNTQNTQSLQVWKSAAVLGILALGMVTPAQAQKQVSRSFAMPASVDLVMSMTGCANSPGPRITLEGAVSLGGLSVEMLFKNNVKGTHTYTVLNAVEVEAVAPDSTMTIPKQPVNGGTGGNPFIWIQIMDGNNHALSGEIFLGRCVQGPFVASADVAVDVTAVADFTSLDCVNNTGPYITVDGAMSLDSGMKGRFIFRNNDNPVDGPHSATRTVDVTLAAAGASIRFPKQPVLGGVGGNPLIYTQFLQADGTPIGSEALLGRCVQLAPGN
jgi:hypothetical protein